MVNRHGLVAGATGTGKTKTLQRLAEQLSEHGVPVFLADIKGDLSGHGDRGRDQRPHGAPGPPRSARPGPVRRTRSEFYALGGQGTGIPIRVSITSFGPLLLSKVLGLNETQESCLGLVFHYADKAGLPLLDLKDLRAVVAYLVERRGQGRARRPGRAVEGDGRRHPARADRASRTRAPMSFFGEPEFDTSELLRQAAGRPRSHVGARAAALQDRPALFSTFLMWLLADLFQDLPEVGDLDKPKLVFFFDEAHLLFTGASKDFLTSGHADRAADPVEGRRRLLRDADPEGRARRRARPARQPGPARTAGLHPGRREGSQGDGVHVPEVWRTTSRRCSPSSASARRSSRCSRSGVRRRRWPGPGCRPRSRSWGPPTRR